MNTSPRQSPPIKRPDLLQPADFVNLKYGELDDGGHPTTESQQALIDLRVGLLHGANYNDPAAFSPRGYDQVMYSGIDSSRSIV
jgi:cyanobactin biosynthesis protein (PatB/AcyB/McaB family)